MLSRLLTSVLTILVVASTTPALAKKPAAAAIGCKKVKGAARLLASELDLVPGGPLHAFVVREGLDSSSPAGMAAIAKEYELDLLVRCTKAEGSEPAALQVLDTNGTMLDRRPIELVLKKQERAAFSDWIQAGALAAKGNSSEVQIASEEPVAASTTMAEAEPSADQPTEESTKAPLLAKAEPVIEPAPVAQAEATTPESSPTPTSAVRADESPSLSNQASLELMPAEEERDFSAVLLAGGALRGDTMSGDLLLRARPFGRSSLAIDLEGGVDREKEFRFLFSASYLFDILGAGLGPVVTVGLDPTAAGSQLGRGAERVARAGAVLLIPIVSDALTLRAEGAYRPLVSADASVLAHGYVAGGSIEGSFDFGFSYALRAEYQVEQDERVPMIGALVGWRL